ncbi:MAG: ATP-binding protein [Deltaproteobacteria bacterium]|nr:ATP-binding protein [Deltaproteobacteria bacterium]
MSRNIRKTHIAAPGEPAPFGSVDELLHAARQMFSLRQQAAGARDALAGVESPEQRREARRALREERAWTRCFHRSFSLTGDAIDLCMRCRRHRLRKIEREILAAAVLISLSLVEERACSCGEIMRLVGVPGEGRLEAMRCLSESGRLFRAKLVALEDDDDLPGSRALVVDPSVLDAVLCASGSVPKGFAVRTEQELYGRLAELTVALRKKSDELGMIMRGFDRSSRFYKTCRKVDRAIQALDDTLELHPGWGLASLLGRETRFGSGEQIVLLSLLGKELGHLRADDELFLGSGLSRAASDSQAQVERSIALLGPAGKLVEGGFIRPCGGEDHLLGDDPRSIERTEFELSDRSLSALALDRRRVEARGDRAAVREAVIRMDQLVLSGRVRRALDLAAAHARHAAVLVRDWGLGEVIAYGRAVSLLFCGPPGVGKTACAEALACELGRPILVADYARIQNCYVGMTEKNIVRTFREAARAGAVLFWDEADAMFYDRDMAGHSWEVRDVNVLLQELERFEGICILATNRMRSLDPALRRRIALEVEFERPDRAMRRAIWQKLMPARMPVCEDVDLERLSAAELTGGEIKNVVLNAARLALARGAGGPVRMGDLVEALEMESRAPWRRAEAWQIGFRGPL